MSARFAYVGILVGLLSMEACFDSVFNPCPSGETRIDGICRSCGDEGEPACYRSTGPRCNAGLTRNYVRSRRLYICESSCGGEGVACCRTGGGAGECSGDLYCDGTGVCGPRPPASVCASGPLWDVVYEDSIGCGYIAKNVQGATYEDAAACYLPSASTSPEVHLPLTSASSGTALNVYVVCQKCGTVESPRFSQVLVSATTGSKALTCGEIVAGVGCVYTLPPAGEACPTRGTDDET